MKRHACWASAVLAALTTVTLTVPALAQFRGRTNVWEFLAEKYDKNGDGRLSRLEYDRSGDTFSRLDRNRDGFLTQDDWSRGRGSFGRGPGQRPGEGRRATAPQAGQQAPDFELPYVKNSDKTVRLSSFAGKRPVALVFGSYT